MVEQPKNPSPSKREAAIQEKVQGAVQNTILLFMDAMTSDCACTVCVGFRAKKTLYRLFVTEGKKVKKISPV